MSWLFSRALVAAYSEASCSGGAPSVPLSGTPMPQAYWWHGRTTDASPRSQSGMTSAPLTGDFGAAVLTWCLEASLARTYQAQDEAPELTASEAECGPKWLELLAKYDRATFSWKTAQCSLLAGLDEFSATWPQWGMMRGGVCWELATSAPPTVEIAYGSLLPTPTATANMLSPSMQKWPAHRNLWLTPVADGDRTTNYAQGETSLGFAVRNWPTPTCHDSRSEWTTRGVSLAQAAGSEKQANGGKLNPTWVEWLMGWPLGWTDCAASATDKYRRWWHSHGAR
jgi:hypothetical protein